MSKIQWTERTWNPTRGWSPIRRQSNGSQKRRKICRLCEHVEKTDRVHRGGTERGGERRQPVSLTQSERNILTHCLGYNYSPRQERNQYLAEVGSADWHQCWSLVKRGLMTKGGTVDLGVAEMVFTATPAGEALVKPKPPTRSQRRYGRYLDIRDVCPDLSFIEFCKREREFYP